jgi:hypothetical protein
MLSVEIRLLTIQSSAVIGQLGSVRVRTGRNYENRNRNFEKCIILLIGCGSRDDLCLRLL